MKFKENLTIIEQKDIVSDIAAETDIEKQAIESVLYSLRNCMEYYAKSATIGEDKNEKFLERVHIKRASKIIANMITERKIESSLS